MIKSIAVSIKGTSPLLMHAYPMVDPPVGWEKDSPEEQAKIAEYRTPEGDLYIPGVAMHRCLIGGGAYSKGKGRATLLKPVAACVLVSPEHILLGSDGYSIDSRPVVIPATRGRIIRHRPRFDDWEVAFEIQFDTALLSEEQLRQVVDDAGLRVGLLDFRPEKKGPFGRFMVTSWENL